MLRASMLVLALGTACPPTAPVGDTSPPKAEPEPRVNEGQLLMPEATEAQICADDCLLLTRHDVHTLKHRFKDICCRPGLTPEDPRCETGVWPFPKESPCEGWKRLEMCVYAKHGYVFKDDSPWKDVFEKEPWYQERGAFSASDMTILVKRNTLALRSFEDGNDCKKPE